MNSTMERRRQRMPINTTRGTDGHSLRRSHLHAGSDFESTQHPVCSATAFSDSIREMTGSTGSPLSDNLRGHMEGVLGHDLSHVRVHTGSAAGEAANRLNARAFAVGADVIFGRGAYQPATAAGQHLIAHELVHTLQQRSEPRGSATLDAQTSRAAEGEANRFSDIATSGVGALHSRPGPSVTVPQGSIQRADVQSSGNEGRNRSVMNLVHVGKLIPSLLDDAFFLRIEALKEEFLDLDFEKVKSMASAMALQLVARFVPGLGTIMLIRDLYELGKQAVDTVDDALAAETEGERGRVALLLGGIIVGWAISRVISKIGQGVRNRIHGSKQAIEPGPGSHVTEPDVIPSKAKPVHGVREPVSVTPPPAHTQKPRTSSPAPDSARADKLRDSSAETPSKKRDKPAPKRSGLWHRLKWSKAMSIDEARSAKIPDGAGLYVFTTDNGTVTRSNVLYVGETGDFRSRMERYFKISKSSTVHRHKGERLIHEARGKGNKQRYENDKKIFVRWTYEARNPQTGKLEFIADRKGLEGSLIEHLRPVLNSKQEGNRILESLTD